MANFAIGASPSMVDLFTFNSSYSMSTIVTAISDEGSGWNKFTFSNYRNQQFFRYTIFCLTGRGIIRVTYPYNSGPTTGTTTPWYRVGNPPFITLQASPSYGFTFAGWQDGFGGTYLSFSNPWNAGWNATNNPQIFANFV